ncbi:uncharacterized protein K452DRAFT_271241 [Aplosporella prunicola CBS 121167]|uniref:pH-response transcription factor pacC/RIM101 n=1 Tax=Aplosporella prunicola CBS 121167 TaxID=1176127 RepID=A0A6A6BFD0_9PEZI|nr:uncharacterized protein K452DRAFT_271241 [Aplosporella prunicola CBS 121167]KAF2141617.1 hypothetical protein K452DRAFT_271241 [Aplosporella prunicola CBS 121167]
MDTSQTSHAIEFQKVLKAFKLKANLSANEEMEFSFTTLQDLYNAIYKMQSHHESTRKMVYMKRLAPFLETMEQYGKVIEIFTNAADVVAFIWGPMKLLLQIASNFSEALSKLLDAYEKIGENMPQVQQYQSLFQESPHMRKVLTMMYENLLDFHQEALRYFRRRAWDKLFQATWRGFTSRIDEIVRNMHRHQDLLHTQANIVEFEEIIKIRAKIDADFQISREEQQGRQRSAIQHWLSAASSEVIQEKGCEVRAACPSSGHWFLADSRVLKWFNPNFCTTPLLWLNGIPGAGKTVLASLIVEKAQNIGVNIAFFYCKYEDTDRNSFIAVARGILSQLLQQNEDLVSSFYEKLSRSGETTLSSAKLAKELLDLAFGACGKTYLVLDGLDECNREERRKVSEYFRNVVCSLPRADADRIRCLFVSQDDGYARKDLKDIVSIKLTAEDNMEDIKSLVQIWEKKIQDKFHFDTTGQDIARTITERSQGMFLFATLMVQHLYNQPTLKDLQQEIQPDTFPRGLNEAYDRILKRIFDDSVSSQQERSSKILLELVVCTKRPLAWHEIQGAISVDLIERIVDETRRLTGDWKDWGSSLLELRSDESVDLVHSSAKKYLIEKGYVKTSEVDHNLNMKCLEYLCFDYLTLPVLETSDPDVIENVVLDGYFAFMEYSVAHWVSHFEADVTTPGHICLLENLEELVEDFLDIHWSNSTAEHLAVSNTMRTKLEPLRSWPSYDKLTQAIIFSRKQLGLFGRNPSDDDVLGLSRVVSGVRQVLERTALSAQALPSTHTKLVSMYGSKIFKCPKINCRFFHIGFDTQIQRDQHVARHERAFLCTIEGCPGATLGFVTLKVLEKHLLDNHDIDDTDEIEFPNVSTPAAKQGTGDIPCPECGKKFTKSYNMNAHLKAAHQNQKRHCCDECNKNFARRSDLLRHMKSHSGEKEHECGGLLKDGNTWGCGAKFTRADKLKQHLQSDAGRRCQQPLFEEQAQEKAERQEAEERERIRAEQAALELERIKIEEEAARERAKIEVTAQAREQARRHADAMAKEWMRIQQEEEGRKKTFRNAQEQSWRDALVKIPAITGEPPSPPKGSTPLPPFSSLCNAFPDKEFD